MVLYIYLLILKINIYQIERYKRKTYLLIMEDIRKRNYSNRLKRRANLSKFFIFLRKNWIKILLLVIIVLLIFVPTSVGSVVGEWFNKLVTAFVENLTF